MTSPPEVDKDAELVGLARSGSRAALGELLLRYERYGRRVIHRRLRDSQLDPEDILQDVALRIVRSLAGSEVQNFRAWYGVVVCHECWRALAKVRSERMWLVADLSVVTDEGASEQSAFDHLLEHTTDDGPQQNPERIYEGCVVREVIATTLQHKCSSFQQAVFILHFLHGYTQAEIAPMLGSTKASVHTTIQKVRHKVRTAVHAYRGPGKYIGSSGLQEAAA